MGGQRSPGFVLGIALAFGVVLAMAATSSKPQSASAAKTPIHRAAHY
jgi:ATP-dependent protease ClpP protease subunit